MRQLKFGFIFALLLAIDMPTIHAQSQDSADFLEEQLKHSRVKTAYDSTYVDLTTQLGIRGLSIDNIEIYIRAFKLEEEIEVFVREKGQQTFVPLLHYKFCSSVGQLGPKSRQGDKQIPEGFYNISYFNPQSNYFLSLKVDYPNKSDSIRSHHKFLGGDIFVHGACETIGCIPITDEKIMELYILSVFAKAGGQDIPIHIFPARLHYANFQYILSVGNTEAYRTLWFSMKKAYDYFERNGYPPAISIDEKGEYVLTAGY